MLDTKKIPHSVMRNLRHRDLKTEEIENSTPEELLNEWLEWEGIIGYTDMIVSALDALRAAQVK